MGAARAGAIFNPQKLHCLWSVSRRVPYTGPRTPAMTCYTLLYNQEKCPSNVETGDSHRFNRIAKKSVLAGSASEMDGDGVGFFHVCCSAGDDASSPIDVQHEVGDIGATRSCTPPCVAFRNIHNSWSPVFAPKREAVIMRPRTDLVDSGDYWGSRLRSLG